jgi:hypothetical protein
LTHCHMHLADWVPNEKIRRAERVDKPAEL